MKAYENVEVELDNEVILKLEETASSLNMTANEFISECLENYISQKVTIDDFKKLLEEDDVFEHFYMIVDGEGKPLTKIRPYTEE